MCACPVAEQNFFCNRRRKQFIEFGAFLSVGLGVFLATDNFAASIALPSIRAGWRSVSTGVWILRGDPNRVRAQICGVYFLATACCQIAATAFGCLVLMVVVCKTTGREPDMDQFLAIMIRLASGVAIASLLGIACSIDAVIRKQRVWVNPGLRHTLNAQFVALDEAPKQPVLNYAVFTLATSLTVPFLVFAYFCLAHFQSPAIAVALLTVGPMLVLLVICFITHRIIAANVCECWPKAATPSAA